jgi:hypothetical protein
MISARQTPIKCSNSCNGSFSNLSLISNVIAASVQDLTYGSHSSQHLAAATAALDHIELSLCQRHDRLDDLSRLQIKCWLRETGQGWADGG